VDPIADYNAPGITRTSGLHVAFQAQIGVPFGEEFGIHRAMRIVAGNATFPERLMLERVGALLGAMAAEA